jgi:hypothetical protein
MNRRTFLSAVVIAPVVAALAACGDPDQSPAEADPTTPGSTPGTTPSTTSGTPPATGIEGIQSLLGIVDSAGLIAAPPEYPDLHNVADASSTVLTINADGGSFVHNAYALGMGGPEETGVRKTLLDATTKLSDVVTAAGEANLGPEEPFEPNAYRFQSRVVDPSELTGQDPAPTVVDWPATSSSALAGATECARLEADAVGSLFADAKQNTYFKDGDVVYQLSVAGVLPGDPAC